MTDTTLYRLVIADDHPLFRGALREAVSGLFARVEFAEAGSFDEVSKLLDAGGDVDLILLDLSHAGRARLFRADVSARAISRRSRSSWCPAMTILR